MTKITTLIHFHATETSYSLDNVAIGGDAINKELNLYLVAQLRTRPFLSALPVIQVVWSCPLRSCPTERTVAQIKILKTRIDRLTNGRTFPSDAVMFLRCRLHGGASSSNSLCPQQLHLQLLPPSPSVSLESSFPPATSSPTLQLPLPPSDGLC